jgi:hypothetical protein
MENFRVKIRAVGPWSHGSATYDLVDPVDLMLQIGFHKRGSRRHNIITATKRCEAVAKLDDRFVHTCVDNPVVIDGAMLERFSPDGRRVLTASEDKTAKRQAFWVPESRVHIFQARSTQISDFGQFRHNPTFGNQ